ncbi:class I SAM-dependent methyltransferase [Peribacillus simplex]|uniref:Class I SAM-dependent methyltransferase n=1 Tax=Peribacillus simplex TaxID=1478 RepID=A0A8B5XP35_9BACI|nr:class I SAM-dependent methyltransferase [Peribacillus simplex]TVX75873.1 class I SAM-dependent methyltransferase [Peribacillus simplex]
MDKIEKSFIINSFHEAASLYADATKKLGLWKSEKYAFEKYLYQNDAILDIGCGTGRTTFALYKTGFKNITGIDLTLAMLNEAEKIAHEYNLDIPFILGDATNLPFKDASFDKAIFAFNGLMQIPQRQHRTLAIKEINRILKPEGIFIFTTHDRDKNENYLNFWEQEEIIWCGGKQDERLYEFGDILTSGTFQKDTYLHIPTQLEVLDCLEEAGLTVIESFYRSELFDENEDVNDFSSDCRFWIVQKSGSAF